MATTVTEQLDSRPNETSDGNFTMPRRFLVGGLTNPQDVKATFGTATTPDAMPNYGFINPSFPELNAIRYSMTPMEGHSDLWEVVWYYQNTPVIGPSDKQPDEVGYFEFNTDQSKNFVDAWREDPGIEFTSAPDGVPDGLRTDIKGQSVDSGGESGSVQRFQSVLEISEVIEWPIPYAAYRNAVGKRNLLPFYGAVKGKLCLTGVQTVRIGLKKSRASFRFVYDEWFHMQQMPKRDMEGTILKKGGSDDGVNPFDAAAYVYWVQPIKGFSDFSNLSQVW